MDCKKAQSYFIARVENRLEGRVCTELDAHLEVCGDCCELFKSMQEGHESICASMEFLAPERTYLTESRLQHILDLAGQEKSDASGGKIINFTRKLKYGGAAAAALIIVVASVVVFGPGDAPESEGEDVSGRTVKDMSSDEATFRLTPQVHSLIELEDPEGKSINEEEIRAFLERELPRFEEPFFDTPSRWSSYDSLLLLQEQTQRMEGDK